MTTFIRRGRVSIIIFIAMFLLVACGQSSEKRSAPQFELPDLNGNIVKLDDLKGEKIYVKFWTSWCSICIAGLDELDELAAEDNDFTVLTIIHPKYNGEKSRENFLSWYESLGYENIPILIDEKGEWTKDFMVMAYPDSFYINEDLMISKSQLGHQTNDDIKKTMRKLK